jgi:hypothetical protein
MKKLSYCSKINCINFRVKSCLILLFTLLYHLRINAQNLTISSSGQTGTSGTNWSISGNTLNVAASGSANIHPNVISNHLNSVGNLTVVLPWQISVIRQCSIDGTITYTGSATRTLTFLIANDIFITTPNQSITATGTGALNVVLRAANSGGVSPDNGRISIRQNNTINTNGGHLWIGGGSVDVTWNGLTVGNHFARTWEDNVPGLWIENSTLNTNGGNVYLAGLSHNSSANSGVNYGVRMVDSDISSVSGNIEINGELRGRYQIGNGTRIESTTTTATSITTTTGSITISGKGYDADPNDNGYRFGAVISGSSSTAKTIISSTSGNIQIEGNAYFTATVNDKEGLIIGGATEIISRSGNITIRGTNSLETSGHYCNSIRFDPSNVSNSIRVGFDGTNSYTGNILIEGNSIYQRYLHSSAGSIAVQTTGTLTIQPTGTAFTYMRADNAGTTLTYDNDWNFGTTLSSFTFGKSTNTTNLTFANVLSPAGPITIYGGNININENLNTSAGASSGNVLIKSSADIILAANKSITTSGASVILWANSDNASSNGSIALRNASSIVTGSNTVSGGHVWLGGGSNGTTWNGLAVGSGYAVPGTSFTPPSGSAADAGIYLEQNSITSFGGNIKISGDAGASGFAAIITYGNTITINAGSGKIEMDGQGISTGPGNRNGILFGLHDKNIFSTVNISSSSTSGDAITITGVGRGTEDAIGLSGTVNITASGGGNIVMNGNALGTGRSIVAGNFYHGILNVFANSGNISLNGNTKAVQVATAIDLTGLTSGPSKINIGQGGSILSSSSNVVLTADNIALAAGGIEVNTSGNVTIEPSSNSFASALTFPITNLSIANTISGLTLGKPTNIANITIANALTIAGPISVYGGDITINNNLTSTNSGSAILVQASGNISTANSAKTISTNNGNISIIGDADANGAGLLNLDYTTYSAGSGNILMRGETFNWTVGTGTSPTISSTTGSFTFESSDAAFGQSVESSWFFFPSTLSAFTMGKNTNTQNVSFSNALTVAGPISGFGGTISVNGNLTSSNGSTISLFGNGLTFGSGITASSSGQLVVAPQTASNTIGLGGATGTLSLPASYFSTNFADGFSNIQIGSNSQTGAISSNAFTLRDHMTFLTSGSLTLGGIPVLGSNNVTLGSAISSITASASAYFQTNGTGVVNRTIANGTNLLFPIGNAVYNPVSIANNTGASDVFSAKVRDEVLEDGTSGITMRAPHVDVTWDITKTNANAGSGINLTLQWNSTQETSGLSSYRLNHYNTVPNPDAWEFAAGTSGSVSGSTTKTMTHTGYTGTFSPFAISNNLTPLPVDLVSFDATPNNNSVNLTWTTFGENKNPFNILKSTDGVNWRSIGTQIPGDNSVHYLFTDHQPAPVNYYQLSQIDNSNTLQYSDIRIVNFNSNKLVISPNPNNGEFTIQSNNFVQFEISDYTGKVIMEGNNSNPLIKTNLSKGIYLIKISEGDKITFNKITVQ